MILFPSHTRSCIIQSQSTSMPLLHLKCYVFPFLFIFSQCTFHTYGYNAEAQILPFILIAMCFFQMKLVYNQVSKTICSEMFHGFDQILIGPINIIIFSIEYKPRGL